MYINGIELKIKRRLFKLYFMKIKDVCASKDTIKKVKRQLTEYVKILANHMLNKVLNLEYIKYSYSSIRQAT